MSGKITLSMIVKDEGKYLKGCLASVKDIVDEIIVADTGSTDDTINIAEEFGAKVYRFKWINDFSAARNFALSKSSGDWILYLDADERLSEKSAAELRKFTEHDQLTGCRCIVRSPDDNNGNPHYMKYVRLFRNKNGIGFTGTVHEQIENSLLSNGYKIVDTGIEITHLGYNVPREEVEKKARRNLDLLIKEYEKNKSAYNAFQLGNTYSVLKEYECAKDYYLEAAGNNSLKSEYKAYAYLNLSDYMLKKHNLDQACKYVNQGLMENPASVLLNILASDIYFRLKKSDDAIQFCKEALKRNKEMSEGLRSADLAVELRSEAIISKGVYYSLLSGNKKYLEYFLRIMQQENKAFYELFLMLKGKKETADIKNEDICNLISNDNVDLFLVIIDDYNDKKKALEILKLLYKRFYGNSRFHKSLGVLYSENGLFDKAAKEFKESLASEDKDPSAVLYYISVLVRNNQFQEIPDLLLFAEKEFGEIQEFAGKFEILKEKLSVLLNG